MGRPTIKHDDDVAELAVGWPFEVSNTAEGYYELRRGRRVLAVEASYEAAMSKARALVLGPGAP